jgi:hypothetical protein
MKNASSTPKTGKKREPKSDPAVSYNEFKDFEGQQYTGMKVGGSHKWYYDKGVWKDTKITPDLWEISYAVTKRRAGRAPEGSGAAVDTEYHWYILAHQNVRKINANDYTTSMTGLKFKIAHKRGGTEKWSVSDKGQRKRMIGFLRGVLEDLEEQQMADEATRKKPVAKAPAKRPAVKAAVPKGRGKVTPKKKLIPKSMAEPKRPRRKATT